ncbi:unnamed protein product [Heterobilharzia americana]|nr:unnamed protein product [Heterobilharzia americana]
MIHCSHHCQPTQGQSILTVVNYNKKFWMNSISYLYLEQEKYNFTTLQFLLSVRQRILDIIFIFIVRAN